METIDVFIKGIVKDFYVDNFLGILEMFFI